MNITAELAVDAHCFLGEGPVWDPSGQQVLWIDYDKGTLHDYIPSSGVHRIRKLPMKVASFALREGGGILIAGDRGLALYNQEDETMEIICDPESHLPQTRFNDGKCDLKGRFFAGTASKGNARDGALYVFYPDGSYSQLDSGIGCSNGITWSNDGKTMYYIDSLAYRVDAFDFDTETGLVAGKRTVIPYQGTEILPDGMTSDEEGMIWVAEWGGWKVSRWNPATGERLAVIELPVKYVTSCVFGGKDMDELYITSASSPLSEDAHAEQPSAGGLFRAKIGIKGRPTYRFRG
ncbi:6-deoxy-6-sulfogluconolactonase [Paenibacillus allorhizoplanae]|uniref:Regucalcin n=1 Tax=Paenibacillus allorhizoplanae TaxID=2905648 RepID=A0ABM9CQH7_9BACL|nr:SMP-30/gluconolactonase/LRE family protein [Paenibacillus allorhizoplanae]CAH1221449.1 6-deoxy-6-sulfogluconolactonase [Paenibacillus allorhizoplanae]